MSSFIPRNQRARIWGERAFQQARANGAKVLEAAEAQIRAVFGFPAIWLDHKLSVERAMQRGAWDQDVRLTFGKIAMLCPPSLTGAMAEIERNYRAEVRHRMLRERNGLGTVSPAHEGRLYQARIFLRWFRRYGDRDAFPEIVETMTTPARWRLQAAE